MKNHQNILMAKKIWNFDQFFNKIEFLDKKTTFVTECVKGGHLTNRQKSYKWQSTFPHIMSETSNANALHVVIIEEHMSEKT